MTLAEEGPSHRTARTSSFALILYLAFPYQARASDRGRAWPCHTRGVADGGGEFKGEMARGMGVRSLETVAGVQQV
jgi:hypothetical protein